MTPMIRAFVVGACLAGMMTGCGSGRVRGAQGTEMGQAREYEPEKKVEPPIGNVERTSGPMTQPDPYPLLEVDLERRQQPPPAEPEPDPEPRSQPSSTE
ncbi:MAG: hypothetical protein JRE81_06135 [Deltaproteobacteria bacterium]|jgi:hypothetical protein|nr:hypothetical protein [Deltaproteobacteria bacterium]